MSDLAPKRYFQCYICNVIRSTWGNENNPDARLDQWYTNHYGVMDHFEMCSACASVVVDFIEKQKQIRMKEDLSTTTKQS